MNKRALEYSLFGIGLIFCIKANALHDAGELTGIKAIIILSVGLVTAGTAFIMRMKRNPH